MLNPGGTEEEADERLRDRSASEELPCDGFVGCIVIRPDGGRYVARAVPDPLAE